MNGGIVMTHFEPMKPHGISLAEAKASFFELVAQVENTGEETILTRRGKPIVKLVPINVPQRKSVEFGFMKGKITYADKDDFAIPVEEWGEIHDIEGVSCGRP